MKRLNLWKVTLLLMLCLFVSSCEKDEIILESPTESVLGKETIEAVALEELPDALLDKVFSVSKKTSSKGSSKLSRKQLLTTYFEPSANVVTTEEGFITYSLIIKKDVDINRFLDKNIVSKKSYRNECSEPSGGGGSSSFDVIALNNNGTSGGGSQGIGAPTHVSFNNINGGILGATFTNINTGTTTTSYTNLNNTGNWNIFKGIWTGIRNAGTGIWKGIKGIGSWIGGLFSSNRTSKCPGSLAKKGDDDKEKENCQDQIDAELDAKSMSLNEFEDKHLLDKNEALDIPLPKELLEPKTLQNRNPKAITTEDFDCACEKDKPFTIAQFLELEFEQMLFLAEDTQKDLRKKICDFVKENNYSDKAKFWGQGQTYLEEGMDHIPWKLSQGEIAGQKYTHSYIRGSGLLSYFKLEDGSIIAASSEEQALTKSGDLKDKHFYESDTSGFRYYYIKFSKDDTWSELLYNPKNHSDELKTLFALAGKELGKNLGRYVLPVEDIKILIDGKDFDGQEVARWQAAGGILLTVVPGGKVVGAGAKVLKPIIKVTKETNVWRVVIKNGSKTYTRIVRELTEETLAHFDRYAPGTKDLIEEALRTGKYVDTTINDAAEVIADISTKKGRTLTWTEVKALFKRGMDFNKKAVREEWYRFNEVTVEQIIGGKKVKFRLDSYEEGLKIVSRKATNLGDIKFSTFQKYIAEIKKKYPRGTKITAPKYGKELEGKVLEGKYYLEVPNSQSCPK